MAVCVRTGEVLPEHNAHFSGFECRCKDKIYCQFYSRCFIDGTNCILLRKPVNPKKILGLEK